MCVLFTYSLKWALEIRKFHVAIVQRRLRNVQKSVMHVQICCFANTNLFFFAGLVAVAVVVAKLPIVVVQKFCYHGNWTSHFSSFFLCVLKNQLPLGFLHLRLSSCGVKTLKLTLNRKMLRLFSLTWSEATQNF